MLEFYKTIDNVTKRIDSPEHGCWISAVAPTDEEISYLIDEIGVMPEFVKSSLDEEESSHIDYDDDENQTLVIVDYPSADDSDDDAYDGRTLQYTTLPLGVAHGHEDAFPVAAPAAHLSAFPDLSAADRPSVIEDGTEAASVHEERRAHPDARPGEIAGLLFDLAEDG